MAIFSANQRLDSSAGISLMLIIAFHIFILAAEPHFQQSGPLSIKHMKVQTFAGNQIAHLGSSTPSTPSSPHPNLFFQGHPPVSLWQSLKVVFWEKEHDFFPITWRGWGYWPGSYIAECCRKERQCEKSFLWSNLLLISKKEGRPEVSVLVSSSGHLWAHWLLLFFIS